MRHGNFLNEEQKKIKQKIMEDLLNSLFGTLEINSKIFDNQATGDIIFTCCVLFTRQVLAAILIASGDFNTKNMILMQYQMAVSDSLSKWVEDFTKSEEAMH